MNSTASLRVAGRDWDQYEGYLFDVDGTLIESQDATHYFAFCSVLKFMSGKELTLEGVTAHGNTDVGILRDAYALAGVKEADWRPRLPELRDAMGAFVEHHKKDLRAKVLPDVSNILKHLKARRAKLGLSTGNLERIGTLKLQQAGLFEYFDFAEWSDAYEYRVDVFRGALENGRRLTGPNAAFCVVGDTPADVRAAHEIELPVIAVATGIYTYEQLLGEQPELCLSSLAELLPKT